MFDFGDLSDAENGEDAKGSQSFAQQWEAGGYVDYKAGDVVKAQFQQGCWYLATITCGNSDGTFTIAWRDGDSSDLIKTSAELVYIRPGDAQSSGNPQQSSQQEKTEAPGIDKAANDASDTSGGWQGWEDTPSRFTKTLKQNKVDQEDDDWAKARMAFLQQELEELQRLAPVVRKARLRKLQLELHPDKQPERLRAQAQHLFLLVQSSWEANEAAMQKEAFARKHDEQAKAARSAAREKASHRDRESQRQHEEKARADKDQQEKANQERRRQTAMSRARQAEEDLKRFKEAAAKQRSRPVGTDARGSSASAESAPAGPWAAPWHHEHSGHADVNTKQAFYKDDRAAGVNSCEEDSPFVDAASFSSEAARPETSEEASAKGRSHGELVERVLRNWRMMQHVPDELRSDRRLAFAAVQQSWEALQFVSSSLRRDRDLVLTAVEQDGLALEHAHAALHADREVVGLAVKRTWRALRYAKGDLLSDSDIVLSAVVQDWRALQHASPVLQGSRELVKTAVQQSGLALQYASSALRKDHDLVLAAVRQNGAAFAYAAAELRADRQFVLSAVWRNASALRFVDPDLRGDREVALAAAAWD
eukprot:TRINITY_DN34244_c0_g1_i2.p1 TRINITY_DN34244_c0_g1~~TRINITY_DN34244_c0_g1_i2.p1  ORF type:complete len:593 (+),score=148.95 TRINITY_DN34244_c0_g1_i2:141-1919(+)